MEVELVEVALPAVTPACEASAASGDGLYACDYPVDELMKAANSGLEAKNSSVFKVLRAFQLTTDQQSEIAGYVDRDGMTPAGAAAKWVADNPEVWGAWLS